MSDDDSKRYCVVCGKDMQVVVDGLPTTFVGVQIGFAGVLQEHEAFYKQFGPYADMMKREQTINICWECYLKSLGVPQPEEMQQVSSDEDLRRRVAKLLGATTISVVSGSQAGMFLGYWPEEDEGYGGGWKPIEDYPNDITAAMTLVDRLEALGYVFILVNTTNGNLKAVRVIEGGARTFPPKYYLDNLEPPSKASANVQDTTLARAITRAFIEVMEGKDRE